MHTYLRFEDGTYTVGMWLPNHEGITSFHKLFDVARHVDAIIAVNLLNGGAAMLEGRELFKMTKEH